MYYINLATEYDKRYDQAKFMEYTSSEFDILNSYFIYKLKSLSVFGEYVVQAEENKPYLVSYNIYGDTQYWWILMIFNDVLNFEELGAETILRYPSLADLEDLYFSLKSLEAGT